MFYQKYVLGTGGIKGLLNIFRIPLSTGKCTLTKLKKNRIIVYGHLDILWTYH